MNKRTFLFTFAIATIATPLIARQHPSMPAGMTHEEHMAILNARGAAAMGFDQNTTAHHFFLYPNGGAIQVEVKDPSDKNTREQVRAHLKQIREEFSRGIFDKPLATHAEVPPGTETMQTLKDHIRFSYSTTPNGGRVRIQTADPQALSAVHDFLRYQIKEHSTGDDTAVRPRP